MGCEDGDTTSSRILECGCFMKHRPRCSAGDGRGIAGVKNCNAAHAWQPQQCMPCYSRDLRKWAASQKIWQHDWLRGGYDACVCVCLTSNNGGWRRQ